MRQTGTVKFFNTTKGYGFITPDGASKDVFVHITAVERSGITNLAEGMRDAARSARQGRQGCQSPAGLTFGAATADADRHRMMRRNENPRRPAPVDQPGRGFSGSDVEIPGTVGIAAPTIRLAGLPRGTIDARGRASPLRPARHSAALVTGHGWPGDRNPGAGRAGKRRPSANRHHPDHAGEHRPANMAASSMPACGRASGAGRHPDREGIGAAPPDPADTT